MAITPRDTDFLRRQQALASDERDKLEQDPEFISAMKDAALQVRRCIDDEGIYIDPEAAESLRRVERIYERKAPIAVHMLGDILKSVIVANAVNWAVGGGRQREVRQFMALVPKGIIHLGPDNPLELTLSGDLRNWQKAKPEHFLQWASLQRALRHPRPAGRPLKNEEQALKVFQMSQNPEYMNRKTGRPDWQAIMREIGYGFDRYDKKQVKSTRDKYKYLRHKGSIVNDRRTKEPN